MHGVWKQTKAQIREMLRRVAELAGDKLELKWVAYRDYCEAPERWIEQSPWSSDPATLLPFVEGIVCDGGGSNGGEAVELALYTARMEHMKDPISRIILIGDDGAHQLAVGEEIDGHSLQTNYLEESVHLAALGIPVYSFALGRAPSVWATFGHISRTTGGKLDELEVSKLIDAVCETALEEIGGAELVAEYRAIHCT